MVVDRSLRPRKLVKICPMMSWVRMTSNRRSVYQLGFGAEVAVQVTPPFRLLYFAGSSAPSPCLQKYRMLFPLFCRGVLLLAVYGSCKLLVRAVPVPAAFSAPSQHCWPCPARLLIAYACLQISNFSMDRWSLWQVSCLAWLQQVTSPHCSIRQDSSAYDKMQQQAYFRIMLTAPTSQLASRHHVANVALLVRMSAPQCGHATWLLQPVCWSGRTSMLDIFQIIVGASPSSPSAGGMRSTGLQAAQQAGVPTGLLMLPAWR